MKNERASFCLFIYLFAVLAHFFLLELRRLFVL